MIDNTSPAQLLPVLTAPALPRLARFLGVIAVGLAVLTGCAIPPEFRVVDSHARGEKSLTMVLVTSAGTINSTFQSPLQLNAEFAMIPGGLGGAPLERDQILVPASFGKPFSVDMAAIERNAGEHAAPPSAEFFEQGFSVSPPTTRLLRVGTFMFDAANKRILAGGALNDADLKSGFLLMYFDRPCQVEGRTVTGDIERTVNVRIRVAGLHWLKEHEVAAGKRVIEPDDGQAAVLFRVQEPR